MSQVSYVAGGELRASVVEGVRERHIMPAVFRLRENLETIFLLDGKFLVDVRHHPGS